MKKFFLALGVIMYASILTAQVTFDALTISPTYPKAGDVVTYKFTKNYSPLINEKKVDVVVYLFNKSGLKVLELVSAKKGDVYSGNFKLDSNTNTIAFSFQSQSTKDNNKGNGYIIPVYNLKKQPVIEHYATHCQLVSGYGEYLFGMGKDASKCLTLFEDGIKTYPDFRDNTMFYSSYLNNLILLKKKDAQPLVVAELQLLQNKKDITEKDLIFIGQWYSRLKMKQTADSFTAIAKAKYPQGEWRKQEMVNIFNKETNADKKKEFLLAMTAAYPAKGADTNQVNFYKSMVAQSYAKEKNYTEFYKWADKLPTSMKAAIFNDVSWNMAEKGEDIAEAKKMSYIATTYAKKEMVKPAGKKPDNITGKQWLENRRMQYGMYADTYGFILYNLGDYKSGLPYAKEGAVINKLKNAEYNERYALLLAKAAPATDAKKIIEKFVEDGVASSKTKASLKDLYITENNSDKGFDTYIQNLEMAAKIKKAEALKKSMINEAAPAFALKDFEGKEVSLASLHGKVLVVDFWATWCGPCIASMPAMKTAQEKLKQRDDVLFLFVDTWESAENKKQNAQDFMKKSNYPFYVLMDDEDKMVSDYKVDGIPTKFIIDKTGRTRFKSVGFGGNDDELVDEVLTMVEMASK